MRIISGQARGTKLFTLEGDNTRPTLDRVKESLFSILMPRLEDAEVLDLFAGSGALGLEALSRGALNCTFCDNSGKAIGIINQNVEKTKFTNNAIVIQKDYERVLKILKEENKQFDIIFLDPPYNTNYDIKAIEKILEYNLLKQNGDIIVETNKEEKINMLKNIDNINISDLRKYGGVTLMFLNRKG